MVGLAAVLAGSVKAPLTAILLLFELTGNYQVIWPVMIAVGICIWVLEQVRSLQSVEGLNLQQMGIDVEKPQATAYLQEIPVSSAMAADYLALPASTRLHEAARTMIEKRCHAALVMENGEKTVGILSLGDVRRKLAELENRTGPVPEADPEIERFCTAAVLYAHASQSLAETVKQMSARGIHLLPVVESERSNRVVGVVERHHISLAKELAETEAALKMRSHPRSWRGRSSREVNSLPLTVTRAGGRARVSDDDRGQAFDCRPDHPAIELGPDSRGIEQTGPQDPPR
jgi:CBS domain-containing protein